MSDIDKQVDPALWPLVEGFPPIELTPETLVGFRAAVAQMAVLPDPATHADVRVEEMRIPGGGQAAQTVRCLLFTPAQRTSGALLHIHGGGFMLGTPEIDVIRNVGLARATGAVILSVDYRLAPEHPHPAGLEDCHAALVWFASKAEALGISRDRIGVIGESAGGGLAASLALLARDRRSVPLACQVLIYPMLMPPATSIDTQTPDARSGRYIWTRRSNNFAWAGYLPDAHAHRETIAGLAENVAGLPPTFLAVGELDLFVHDNLEYVRRLLTAGVSTESHLYPGAIHGFDRMIGAAVSERFTRDLVAFIVRQIKSPQAPGG